MTIAVSIKCRDGVVLGTDSLITHGNANIQPAFAHHESKIYECYEGNIGILIAGAGDTPMIRSVAEKTIEAVSNGQGPLDDPYVLKGEIEPILQNALDTVYQRLPQPGISNTLLIAFTQKPWDMLVLRSDDLIINQAKEIEIAGIGENSLLHFLKDHFYSARMEMKAAICLCIFLIYEAKTYCPQYCGGNTQIQAIQAGSNDGFVWITEDEIEEIENLIKGSDMKNIGKLFEEMKASIK